MQARCENDSGGSPKKGEAGEGLWLDAEADAYIHINEIKVNNNLFIKKYIIEESEGREYQSFVSFVKLLSKLDLEYNIENLIELFEFVISPAEKEVNGAVYTPQYVREFIVQGCFDNFPLDDWRNLRIADISCGCGGFFISIAEYLKNKIHLYRKIKIFMSQLSI